MQKDADIYEYLYGTCKVQYVTYCRYIIHLICSLTIKEGRFP